MPVVGLPNALSQAIAAEGERLPAQDLVQAAQRLSSAYRRETAGLPVRLNEAERVAYVAMRLPATYAAVCAALDEMARVVDVTEFDSCLDAGSGPGTASLAARERLASLSIFKQIERDGGWSSIAARLSGAMGFQASRGNGDIVSVIEQSRTYDLVLAAYVLNELPRANLDGAIRALWSATASALVVVEPGTPHGFEVVGRVRTLCLESGGFAAAPCTHNAACPMTPSDWCHRAVRVERSPLHRKLKDAALGFEDEKFSYVVITRRAPTRLAPSRIVRRPIRAGGHVHLDLCSENGLTRSTITRADRSPYKAARDADWGDLWPPTKADDGALG